MASAPRVLDQAYVPQSSAEKGESRPTSPVTSPRPTPPSTPKEVPPKPFHELTRREQDRILLGSRRRKTRASKKSRKQRRKTLKRRAK